MYRVLKIKRDGFAVNTLLLASHPKSTLTIDSEAINKRLAQKARVENRFLHWFSGFTDAEGKFLISIDRKYVKLRFKICLHIDDLRTLQVIQSNLNIGRVTEEKNMNRCSFIVEYISGITTICSIFNIYPLHTSKKLDFNSFYEAYLIKINNKNLSDTNLCASYKFYF